ncbi:endonuclease V [Streptomyces acidicola]|uniref:Endonuclease V n=1 Tax=Streptomyces acidicola TaxID=2596892 RepID=A0A5N8WVP7_9ACTN|nr:endonuclease V [Streptomyces acidicola]MPY51359.1 endonuclease V [Streptomyces acidicola]
MTTVRIPAGWPATEEQARAVQDELRNRVVLDEDGPEPGTGHVTGVDVAYDDERDVVAAAAVVLDAATLDVVAEATAVGQVSFPYVPGLLAFREIPTVLAALDALPCAPGLVVCDGYGLAHPRRFGLASHLGVLSGHPTIGVAKNPFTFRYDDPGPARGSAAPLLGPVSEVAPAGQRLARPLAAPGESPRTSGPSTGSSARHAESTLPHARTGARAGGPPSPPPGPPFGRTTPLPTQALAGTEEVGRALRTRDGVKPVFVSVGHRVSLDTACAHTLALTPEYRIPESTRRADSLCRQALKEATVPEGDRGV